MSQNHTAEQAAHFSPDLNHWCIVSYVNQTPFYYTGYFGSNKAQNIELQPALSIDFNNALKCHSKIAAEQILTGLKNCSKADNFVIEDHKYIKKTQQG